MIPLSMILSDLWPRFQGHDIFEVEYRKTLKTKLLLHKRKLYLTYGMLLCLVTLIDLLTRRAGLSASAELLVLIGSAGRAEAEQRGNRSCFGSRDADDTTQGRTRKVDSSMFYLCQFCAFWVFILEHLLAHRCLRSAWRNSLVLVRCSAIAFTAVSSPLRNLAALGITIYCLLL